MSRGPLRDCASLLEQGFCQRLLDRPNRRLVDWVEEREAELRRSLKRTAERWWCEGRQKEDWERARDAVETLLSLSPSNEEWLRGVVEARSKTTGPAEARGAIRDFGARIRSLRGTPWAPAKATQYLLREVEALADDDDARPRTELATESNEPPLLGRTREKAWLRTTLKVRPKVRPGVIVMTGEAGIGKTRLIREALRGIELDGYQVLSAGCAELEQMIPLNVLIDALRPPGVGQTLRDLQEPWRTVLFGVMPIHYLGKRPIPEAPHIQPGSVPRRLFEAFYRLLGKLAGEKPLILVLEDLQWADDTTLAVLEFLVRRWDQGGLQLIISVRSEERRRHSVLESFLKDLRAHEDSHELYLDELLAADGEALIRALSSRPLRAGEIAHIQSLAGGNPFFLIELTLEYLAGRLDSSAEPQEILPIPLSIRQVLQRRLTALSADAERVLRCLAVYSRSMDASALAQTAELPLADCVAGLDQLHRFRLVTGLRGAVTVSHELIRHTVYQELSEPMRAWLHHQVALHILNHGDSPPPDELALHFHLAGAGPEARKYACEAASKAEASGAIAEALRFLRIAREHSEDPSEVADLIWRMGHLNYLHQNLEEAAPLLELAANRLRRHGRRDDALRAEVERVDSLAQRGLLPLTECLEELQRVKGEASLQDYWEVHHQALEVEAHQFNRIGDLAGVRRVLAQARQFSNRGTPDARCKAWALLALNVYFASPTEALHAAREAVAIAETTSDSDALLHALNRLIVVLHYAGRLHSEEGTSAIGKATSRLGTCGDLNLKAFVHLNRAVWHLEIGELERARSAFGAVEKVLHGTGARDARIMLNINLGELGLTSADIPSARGSYRQAEDLIEPSSPHFFQTLIQAGLGMCALHVGELAEARRREGALPALPDFWTFDPSVVATFKAEMLASRRDFGNAIGLLETVRENVKDRFVPAWLRLTMHQCRMLRRQRHPGSGPLANEGLRVARSLGLHKRVQHFLSLGEGEAGSLGS